MEVHMREGDSHGETGTTPMERIVTGARRGGRARARKLPPEKRTEIARLAAETRWQKGLARATHTGELDLGGTRFECAVLEDGTRVISETSFMAAMGIYWSGYIAGKRRERAAEDAAVLPLYLSFERLKPHIDKDLHVLLSSPLKYRTQSGGIAHGIRAEIVPRICNVWLKARDAGGLGRRQVLIAQKADILMRGLAQVGIIALIDEATGYQYDRARAALAEILEAFVAEELRKWVKTFPTDFYREMFRLRGWTFHERSTARSPLVGKLTNNVVYQRLAPGVLKRLREKNPVLARGRRRHKHFQWLTEDVGDPKLREHLAAVTDLMKISDTWKQFMGYLDRARPRYLPMPLFEAEDGTVG